MKEKCLSLDEQMDILWEEAYVNACELDSPNSPDFDSIVEREFERLCQQPKVKNEASA